MRSLITQGIAAAIMAVLLPVQSLATEPFAKVGTYALPFLKIGVSARAIGNGRCLHGDFQRRHGDVLEPGGSG